MYLKRIHCIEHAPYESSGIIQYWAEECNHPFSRTLLYKDEVLPSVKSFDWLIVMGGPMSVHDEGRFHWMTAEKKLIEKAILEGKVVIGFCFGAQLLASVMGARVYKNKAKEIGWFPVTLNQSAKELSLYEGFPDEFMTLLWHAEMFDIPALAVPVGSSAGCANQGFVLNESVMGFQFHLEMTSQSIIDIIDNCRTDLTGGKFIQSEMELLNNIKYTVDCNNLLEQLLVKLDERSSGTPIVSDREEEV